MNFKFILFFNFLFFSCSSVFKKCDYCNLKYNNEEIVYSIETLISYHESCQNGFYNTDVKSIDYYYKVDNISKAERLIKIIRAQLDKIGLNNIDDVINIKLLKRKDYNNRRG